MQIYIDSDYKCHLENNGEMAAIKTDAFDGKCKAFIEGYRFVPEGKSWTRSDGEVFTGEMITPHTDYSILEGYQQNYEELLAELDLAYREGVNSNDDT